MDVVTNYFIELKKAVEFVEGMNGHKLLPNEMLNLDETGFDLSNCSKTMRVIIRTTKFKRQPKAAHQGNVHVHALFFSVSKNSRSAIFFYLFQVQQIELIFQRLFALMGLDTGTQHTSASMASLVCC